MDATDYELKMREFVAALQPMHEFFMAEAASEEKAFSGLTYTLLCGAIAGNIADLEYRLQERAGDLRFGRADQIKARTEADDIQAEEERDSAPLRKEDVL